MNIYLIGVCVTIILYIIIGMCAGSKVKNKDDYFVAGRRAPTILITGSLIASFLSSGVFLGDTGEIYSGIFTAMIIGGVIQASGYIWGASLFGRYIRRSEAVTLPEYFGKRFQSKKIQKLSAVITVVSVIACMLSTMQGISVLMQSITGLDYKLCVVLAWISFTLFSVYSGSVGVLITDTIMFLIFLVAAIIAFPFVVDSAGGWLNGIHTLVTSESCSGIISWHGNLEYLYPTGAENLAWAFIFGFVWMLVAMVSPWQTSRYLMAKNEHVVFRSAIWSTMGVTVTIVCIYTTAAFVQAVNPNLVPTESFIWAAMNLMPSVIGVLLLAGILAAGISSASTYLSLIGFSVVNDFVQINSEDEKKTLRISRLAMLFVGIFVLLMTLYSPPQIFVIVYFGGTVIAGAWGPVSFASVWSKKISKTGAFLGMLLGFIVTSIIKIISSMVSFQWPIYLDALILGVIAGIIGIAIGNWIKPVSDEEKEEREKLFIVPECEKNPEECRKTVRMGYFIIAFGIFVFVLFLVAWALPCLGVY